MSNLVVQTNVLALNSHRNLKTVGGKLSTASARLSSGYKINSAADDASGLAISEKMRAQIRGLDMASKNTQDGISLVQTAEGGLQEIDNMLQRIRELTVQASNDTNDYQSADRKKLQEEIDQLTSGIDAMAGQVEFNKKKLLDGSLTDASTKGSLLADINVKMQNVLGTNISNGSNASDLAAIMNTSNGGELNLRLSEAQNKTFATQVTYNVSVTNGGATGSFVASANSPSVLASSATQVSSNAPISTQTSTSSVETATVSTGGGTVSGQWTYRDTAGGTSLCTVSAASNTSATTITGYTNTANSTVTHGVATTSVVGGSSGTGVGTSYAITLTLTNAVAATTTTGISHNYITSTTATSNITLTNCTFNGIDVLQTSNVSDVQAMTEYIGAIDKYMGNLQDAKKNGAAGVDDIMANLAYNRQAAIDIYSGLELASAQSKSYAALDALNGNSLWFQTGANSEQGIQVGIGKVTSDILGIGKGSGISTIRVDKPNANEVSSQIDIVDNALQYVTSQRAKLGAVQNRMEYTKSSLEVSSENLSAAESRIRDTDMAKEMMKLTSANVLQQAGVSMLSQANQAPQSVLSLLR